METKNYKLFKIYVNMVFLRNCIFLKHVLLRCYVGYLYNMSCNKLPITFYFIKIKLPNYINICLHLSGILPGSNCSFKLVILFRLVKPLLQSCNHALAGLYLWGSQYSKLFLIKKWIYFMYLFWYSLFSLGILHISSKN